MNNNQPSYFDDAAMQINSAEQLQNRFSNNQGNNNPYPYMPHDQPNQPAYVEQPKIGYPPAYNQNSPAYYNPPPNSNYINIVPQHSPVTYVIDMRANSEPMCHICHKSASCISRKRCGCALATWSTCLFFFTGILCWVPCCIDQCWDY